MNILEQGKVASSGIAIGTAYLYHKEKPIPCTNLIAKQQVENELNRYKKAVNNVEKQLAQLAIDSKLFAAHIDLLNDFALKESVETNIRVNLQNAELALHNATAQFCAIFQEMEDEYMSERCADLEDVCYRVLLNLKNIEGNICLENIQRPVILIAEDLAPSDTAKMNLDSILGFVTQAGGVTSHVSIMARSMGLPAIVGARDIFNTLKNGDTIILDALNGKMVVNPTNAILKQYQKEKASWVYSQQVLQSESHEPAITTDGFPIKVYANAGCLEDVRQAKKRGAEGIGLFRTEFIFMEAENYPSEEQQFEIYRTAAQMIEGEVVIRTLDIGGDKSLPYHKFEAEENPFLGCRAIRVCLAMPEMFKTQLRAILRASAFGQLAIMFPMIISQEELVAAKSLLAECRAELEEKGLPYDENIRVGMMIETPASVLLASEFARQIDFFSIGTNDLTQYILAVDRGNITIADLYNSFHPAVLRSISAVIDAAHQQNIQVGMCGEFAANPAATKLLLGMGLDEFSVASGSVPMLKKQVRCCSHADARKLAAKVKHLSAQSEIAKVLGI